MAITSNKKAILQGTTPYLVIPFASTGLDVSDFTDAELTLKYDSKYGCKTKTYSLESMSVDTSENTLSYHFTEQETLFFSAKSKLSWQIYVKIDDEVYGTKESVIDVYKKIKGVVMDD